MRKIFLAIFFSLIFCLNLSSTSRILIAQTTVSKSHVLTLQTLGKLLAARGHEITFISPFPEGKVIKNYREIRVHLDESDLEFSKDTLKNAGKTVGFGFMMNLAKVITKVGNNTLQSEEVRKMMNEEKFDLLIIGFFFNDFLLGLGDHFKCPTIVFNSFGLISSTAAMVGNPLGIPAAQHSGFITGKTGFLSRLATLMIYAFESVTTKFLFKESSKSVYDFNFPPDRYRSYEESLRNVSLILLNTHFSAAAPRPYLPNVIEVGGLQVKPTPLPLPDDLQKFLDDAENGAILFSLGSNVKSNYLSEETLKTILKVFSKIKQRIVMKWESDELKGRPENVFISKWLPQDDVLAHKNLKAFISHCGLGGVVEAKYHGVPIIGIPIFGDQPANADNVVREGWGIKIDFSSLTEELLLKSINEVINNSTYAENVQRYSQLAKDRPMNAQDTAVYWVEYVIRHHGAPHMHYPGADLNFFQDNSLDLIAFIIIVIFAIYKIFKFIILKLYRLCCKKKQKTQ